MVAMAGKKSFAERLRAAREDSGLTQDELAIAAGIGRSLVRKMEQGKADNPTLHTLLSLARVLGVTLNDLAGEDCES